MMITLHNYISEKLIINKDSKNKPDKEAILDVLKRNFKENEIGDLKNENDNYVVYLYLDKTGNNSEKISFLNNQFNKELKEYHGLSQAYNNIVKPYCYILTIYIKPIK